MMRTQKKVKKQISNTRVLGIENIPVVKYVICTNNSLPANKDPLISFPHQSWSYDKDDEAHDCAKLSSRPPRPQTEQEKQAELRGMDKILRSALETLKNRKK